MSATEPVTEGVVDGVSKDDMGPWKGVLSDGTEPVEADVTMGPTTFKGSTVFVDGAAHGTAIVTWYSPDVASVSINETTLFGIYFDPGKVPSNASGTGAALQAEMNYSNLEVLNKLGTRAERAIYVKQQVLGSSSRMYDTIWTGRLYDGTKPVPPAVRDARDDGIGSPAITNI